MGGSVDSFRIRTTKGKKTIFVYLRIKQVYLSKPEVTLKVNSDRLLYDFFVH